MLSIISICLSVVGACAVFRRNKFPAWGLLTAANSLSLADAVSRSDATGITISAVGLAVCTGWFVVLAGRGEA